MVGVQGKEGYKKCGTIVKGPAIEGVQRLHGELPMLSDQVGLSHCLLAANAHDMVVSGSLPVFYFPPSNHWFIKKTMFH